MYYEYGEYEEERMARPFILYFHSLYNSSSLHSSPAFFFPFFPFFAFFPPPPPPFGKTCFGQEWVELADGAGFVLRITPSGLVLLSPVPSDPLTNAKNNG